MLYYKTIPSPIGLITLVASDEALIALYIKDEEKPKLVEASKNESHQILLLAEQQLREYFNGDRQNFDLPLMPQGTKFQIKAWSALSKIRAVRFACHTLNPRT